MAQDQYIDAAMGTQLVKFKNVCVENSPRQKVRVSFHLSEGVRKKK